MREQLIQYVSLLFAGASDCEDIKQEILQNTLDRYDDLIAEGKSPEAAYRLAITGIGDINEILGRDPQIAPPQPAPAKEQDSLLKKCLRAAAIFLYIICPIPLFILSEFLGMDTIGLCGTISIVAVATVLMILGGKKQKGAVTPASEPEVLTPQQELSKSIGGMIWAVGLALYFLLSFATGAWHITWVIFPLIGAVRGLVQAVIGCHSPAELRKGICKMIWAVGLAIYFIVSFETGAWFITWVLFPIIAAAQGLVKAILDLKEIKEYEK